MLGCRTCWRKGVRFAGGRDRGERLGLRREGKAVRVAGGGGRGGELGFRVCRVQGVGFGDPGAGIDIQLRVFRL